MYEKKEHTRIIPVLLAMLLLVIAAGCGAEQPDSGTTPDGTLTQPVVQPQESDSGIETPDEPDQIPKGDNAEESDYGPYAAIIDQYHTALLEQWDEEQLFEHELCHMAAYHYDGAPLQNLGYALMDLDGDGSSELIIGPVSGDGTGPILYDLYTAPDGAAKRLAVSHERNRYYLEWLEDDAMYMIANEAANSAANSAWHYYTLSAGELQVVQGVVFDALADEANPWFLTIDDDWDTSNDTPEDEELAMAVIDSHTSRYFKPEYTAFENISN